MQEYAISFRNYISRESDQQSMLDVFCTIILVQEHLIHRSNMLQTTHHMLSPAETWEFQKNVFSIATIADQLNNVVPQLCYYFSGTVSRFSFMGPFVNCVTP